jgi:hypothetical protein
LDAQEPHHKFLMEYKAVYAILSGDGVPPAKANVLPQTLALLLNEGRVFFSDDERDMFKKCTVCGHLLKEHKNAFLGVKHTNFAAEAALADKLEEQSVLRVDNRLFVDRYIRAAGIAGNMGLICVRGNHTLLANPGLVCKAASVACVDVGLLDDWVHL